MVLKGGREGWSHQDGLPYMGSLAQLILMGIVYALNFFHLDFEGDMRCCQSLLLWETGEVFRHIGI